MEAKNDIDKLKNSQETRSFKTLSRNKRDFVARNHTNTPPAGS